MSIINKRCSTGVNKSISPYSQYTGNKCMIFHTEIHVFFSINRVLLNQGKLKFYSITSYFNFPIVSFPFICRNIPAAPAYGAYISQLIRYSRAYGSYQNLLDRGLLQTVTRKLLNQGFLLVKLKSSLRKFYSRHHNLVDCYGISVSQITTDMFHFS